MRSVGGHQAISLLNQEYIAVYDDVRYYLTKAIKGVALRLLEEEDDATIKAATAHIFSLLLLVKLPNEKEFKPKMMVSLPGGEEEEQRGDEEEEEEEDDEEMRLLFGDSDDEEQGGGKSSTSQSGNEKRW